MFVRLPKWAIRVGLVGIVGVFVLGFSSPETINDVNHAIAATNPFKLLSEVKSILRQEYFKKELDDTSLEYGAIKGMLKSLEDPYTRFLDPKSFKEMNTRLKGNFFGIGIHIGMQDDQLTIISPMVGTPAYEAGLKARDKITKIDGKSTEGMSLTEAVSFIRGPKGSTVVLSILRGEKYEFDANIVRNRIRLKAVQKVGVLDNSIGYIKLSTFENKNVDRQMDDALHSLEKENISALILDLRDNGGGLLGKSVTVASFFLKGPVVHTVNREGKRSTKWASGRPNFTEKPLAVLVNEGTASASEILAGAIKDNGRGTIIGTNTFGKASVQKILRLSDGSAVLYTINKYLTPNGTDITKTGITANIEQKIPSESVYVSAADPEYNPKEDIQLQRALQFLREGTPK